jgi:hypothetical protein
MSRKLTQAVKNNLDDMKNLSKDSFNLAYELGKFHTKLGKEYERGKTGSSANGLVLDIGDDNIERIKQMRGSLSSEETEKLRNLTKSDIGKLITELKTYYLSKLSELTTSMKDSKKVSGRANTFAKLSVISDELKDMLMEMIQNSENLQALVLTDHNGNQKKLVDIVEEGVMSPLMLASIATMYKYDNDLHSNAIINKNTLKGHENRSWIGADDIIRKYLSNDILESGRKKEEEIREKGFEPGDYKEDATDDKGNYKSTKEGNIPYTAYMKIPEKKGLFVVGPAFDEEGKYITDENGNYQYYYEDNDELVPTTAVPVNQSNIHTVITPDLMQLFTLPSLMRKKLTPIDDDQEYNIPNEITKKYDMAIKMERDRLKKQAKMEHKERVKKAESEGANTQEMENEPLIYEVDYMALAEDVTGLSSKQIARQYPGLYKRVEYDSFEQGLRNANEQLKSLIDSDFDDARSQSSEAVQS